MACTFGGARRIWYGKVSTRVRVRSRREPRRARVGKSKARVRVSSARVGASHGVREGERVRRGHGYARRAWVRATACARGKARVRVCSVRMGANHGVREGKGKPCEREAAEKESAGGAVTASAKPMSAIQWDLSGLTISDTGGNKGKVGKERRKERRKRKGSLKFKKESRRGVCRKKERRVNVKSKKERAAERPPQLLTNAASPETSWDPGPRQDETLWDS
ncbi:hypothetical protein B0H16DRAFT_1462193 [Mycena metata]|uniref:Uncharacterized protein n=1 Tax=Mycena metata TaxID=1033252 RepID=A0AAD7IQ97_9AGAR|nr:hypothetical protein B0H16DRAFT_1462193 [Mycena metata]